MGVGVSDWIKAEDASKDLDTLAALLAYWPRHLRGEFSIYGPTALAKDAFEIVDRLYPDGPE